MIICERSAWRQQYSVSMEDAGVVICNKKEVDTEAENNVNSGDDKRLKQCRKNELKRANSEVQYRRPFTVAQYIVFMIQLERNESVSRLDIGTLKSTSFILD